MAQSTPKLAIKEMVVTSASSKTSIIGTDITASNNVMLRRGGAGELEIASANDATAEGSRSPNKVQVNVKNALIGTNVTLTNNIKLHRSGNGELGFVLGNDTQTEGNRSINNALIQAKAVVLGDSPNQSFNAKIRRAGNGVVQFVLGNDSFADGTLSPNYAHVLGSIPIGAIVAWNPGYYLTGSNGTFVKADFISANTVAGANAYLNTIGFWVADGTVPAITGSLIWNAAGRYLPNLSDDRFLMGGISVGNVGGSNFLTDHTHAHTIAATQDAHTHIQNSHNHTQDAHNHGISDPGHRHQLESWYGINGDGSANPNNQGYGGTGPLGWTINSNYVGTGISISNATATNIATTATNQSTTPLITVTGTIGSGSAATSTENRPKYLGTYFIVRVF